MTTQNKIPSAPALAKFLDNAFQQYPASRGVHQVTFIFQDLIERYPEIITYGPFVDIFKAKISTKEMADKIIEWRRSHTKTFTGDMEGKIIEWRRSHRGRGQRHRGMAKSWQLFLDAEDILFFPREIEKKFKISIQQWDLYAYLRIFDKTLEHKLAPTHEEIPQEYVKAVFWSYKRLQELQKQFHLLFDPTDSKHLRALMIFYDMDQILPLPLAKGKQVTPESIKRGVFDVIRYLNQKSKPTRKKKGKIKDIRRTEDFYKHKKLYYLILMFSFADQVIFHGGIFLMLSSIIKQKLLDVSIPLMRFIPFKDRCTVIQELDEASNRLLPF
jgi:hypothetical protein